MRLFLAISFPDELRKAIWSAAEPLRRAAPGVRWTDPERMHLTLRFLGERSEEEAGRVAELAREVAARHAPIEITVGGIGGFPNAKRPRVVWIGIEQTPRLELLAHDLEEALGVLGIQPEGRPFRPHVTLARVRDEERAGATRALSRAAPAISLAETIEVATLELMHSRTGAGGPVYTVVASLPLAREGRDARTR